VERLSRILPSALRKGGVDYARRARLLVGITLSILAFNLLVTIIFLFFLKERDLARASAMASVGCAMVIPLLRISGSVTFAGNVLLVDMWAMLHILAIYLTGAHDAPVAWIILLPVLAITICNTASGIVWTVFAAVEIAFFTWLASQGTGHLMWEGQEGRLTLFALTHAALLALLATTAFLYEGFKDRTLARLNSANKKLAQARDRALEANRAKSTFVANMSHELRTPLNAVIGYADMLSEDVEAISPQELRADLARIKSSGKHLLRLINELLEFSRMEAGRIRLELEEFSAQKLASELVQTMENEARKNKNVLDFEAEPGSKEGGEAFCSDPTKLRQCLYNLISNACKFTHEGRILVRLKRLPAESPQGTDLAVFEVIDNGIGMTAEQLERVFEPFVQAEESIARRYGGTGLGLSLSRRLAEALGGALEAYSKEGEGSRFVLTIPHATVERADGLS
jgi:signal transduction histidine kinase